MKASREQFEYEMCNEYSWFGETLEVGNSTVTTRPAITLEATLFITDRIVLMLCSGLGADGKHRASALRLNFLFTVMGISTTRK